VDYLDISGIIRVYVVSVSSKLGFKPNVARVVGISTLPLLKVFPLVFPTSLSTHLTILNHFVCVLALLRFGKHLIALPQTS